MIIRILFFILVIVVIVIITKLVNLKETDYLILVNKKNKMPSDWNRKVELIKTRNAWNKIIKVEKETFKKYKELKKELEKEGIIIDLDTVYRTPYQQQQIWDEWKKAHGLDYVHKYVAVPGYSEHHTGLAVDVCLNKNGQIKVEVEDLLKEKEIFSKIHPKLAKYGFILRYPKGKEKITGYGYEPWHFRYVGSPVIAEEIAKKGITLEEYYTSRKKV